ncbi:MAG: 50S ribosomal protein L21 [Deltaproteobacteria bacterium]|nr:MAG: 50S ribosomal protein L21 [Deltaproteobacteria bacterium]
MLGGEGDAKVGQPLISGAKVMVKIVTQGRGQKIRVFKRRKRKGFHKTIGHRQYFTEIEITQIAG